MGLPELKYYKINPSYSEDEVYTYPVGYGMPTPEDAIIFRRNDVTRCYCDSNIQALIDKGAIIKVDEKQFEESPSGYAEYIEEIIVRLKGVEGFQIKTELSQELERTENRQKLIDALKISLATKENDHNSIKEALNLICNEIKETIKGFHITTQLPKEVLEKVFNRMLESSIIKGNITDFVAIFSNGYAIKPLLWMPNTKQPNKAALFVFLKLALVSKTVSRKTLRIANTIFKHEKVDEIFKSDYTYPKMSEVRKNRVNYLTPIKDHLLSKQINPDQLLKSNNPEKTDKN